MAKNCIKLKIFFVNTFLTIETGDIIPTVLDWKFVHIPLSIKKLVLVPTDLWFPKLHV